MYGYRLHFLRSKGKVLDQVIQGPTYQHTHTRMLSLSLPLPFPSPIQCENLICLEVVKSYTNVIYYCKYYL